MIASISFIGAGPGRPDLITVRGLQLVQRADVVLTDDLVHPEIYLRYARPDAEIVRCGKRGGRPSTPQDEVNALTLHYARMGKSVVRLKGGDTMMFGRLREELDNAQAADIACEIVPGVTAASGCSAYAGPLLTERQRGRAVTFMTGTTADGSVDWASAARLGLIVLYMGVTGMDQHVAELRAAGIPEATPIALVRWGTRGLQERWTTTLGEVAHLVANSNIRPPALVMLGNGVHELETLDWWTSKPLFGTTLLMFRPDARGWLLADRLRELGCEVQNLPTRRPAAVEPSQHCQAQAVQIFTSALAVHYTPPLAHGCAVVAVGPSTAQALQARGYSCQTVGHGEARSLESYLRSLPPGSVVQHWCGEDKRAELEEICRTMPITYRPIVVYRMQPWRLGIEVAQDMVARAPAGSIVYATSPRTFAPVAEAVRARGDALRLWAIGHTTAQELSQNHFAVARILGDGSIADHDAQLEHALREHAHHG